MYLRQCFCSSFTYDEHHCLHILQTNPNHQSCFFEQDIAPFAVLSTYDTMTQRYQPPAPWRSFEALADSALLPDGLTGPAMCKPVFDFDVSKIDDPKAAKRQLQQYLATMDMFKGRYRAMPLPPVHSAIPAIDEVISLPSSPSLHTPKLSTGPALPVSNDARGLYYNTLLHRLALLQIDSEGN